MYWLTFGNLFPSLLSLNPWPSSLRTWNIQQYSHRIYFSLITPEQELQSAGLPHYLYNPSIHTVYSEKSILGSIRCKDVMGCQPICSNKLLIRNETSQTWESNVTSPLISLPYFLSNYFYGSILSWNWVPKTCHNWIYIYGGLFSGGFSELMAYMSMFANISAAV